jgi:hypothetical protein
MSWECEEKKTVLPARAGRGSGAQVLAADGVEAGERLVQDEQVGVGSASPRRWIMPGKLAQLQVLAAACPPGGEDRHPLAGGGVGQAEQRGGKKGTLAVR